MIRPRLLLSLLAALLAGCDAMPDMMSHHASGPGTFASNGERIYFTGTGETGQVVTYRGGATHFRMMGGGCASCHGADRRGRRLLPEFWLTAPPLTASALFGDHSGDGHGDHAPYTPESLRAAVSGGLTPDGHRLHEAMPRWSMDAAAWHDLITYLQQ